VYPESGETFRHSNELDSDMNRIVQENPVTSLYFVRHAHNPGSMSRLSVSGWRMKSMYTVVIMQCVADIFRLLYRPSFVGDGNFKLEHLAMRRPENDVFLRDGQGHIVGRERYRTHLNATVERLQVEE
jgi:hypothetical protein